MFRITGAFGLGIIRLLLALSVVVRHSPEQRLFGIEFVGGQAAVQAFYVISGFYMALVLNRKYPAGLDGYKTFMQARLFRLFPAYLFVFFLAIALAATMIVPHPALDVWQTEGHKLSIGGCLLFGVTQFTLLGQDAVWFSGFDPSTGHAFYSADGLNVPPGTMPGMIFLFVAQAWTLGIEILFYLLAPFIVRSVPRIVVLFGLSWVLRVIGFSLGYREDPWSYRFFPFELGMFLLGSGAYHAFDWLGHRRPDWLRRLGTPALVAMLCMLFLLFKLPGRTLMVVFATAAALPFIFERTRHLTWDRWLGELSYPIYISHELVRLAMRHYFPETGVVAFVIATLIAATVLMLCVEHPFERLRARFVARRTDMASTAG